MEVYYKELISEEGSLDRLVDELTRAVQGADEVVAAVEAHLPQESRNQIRSYLERLKDTCGRIKESAVAGAAATDKMVRRYPYSSLAIAFGLGMLTAAMLCRSHYGGHRQDDSEPHKSS